MRRLAMRLQMWWEHAFWVIPLTGVVAAIVIDAVVDEIDEELADSLDGITLLSPASSATLLASIGGGMVTFTGFVFSVILLVIQFGSSTYSPRAVSYFLRSRVTQSVLAIFVGTSTYAFLALINIGSVGRDSYVPVLGVLVSILSLLASLVGFLVLIQSVSSRIRVDSLLSALGRLARRAVQRRAPGTGDAAVTVLDHLPGVVELSEASAGVTVVRRRQSVGQVVALDIVLARKIAARRRTEITFVVHVGDGIAAGATVALVHGDAFDPRWLDGCLVAHRERSLRYDPLYALRIVVDVGLRALSPAINDPTTAVRALDEVEGVLRVAAPLPLGPVRIAAGAGAVVVPGSSWSDVVDLAIREMLEAGIGAPQITRRLTALLDDLLADLPVARHAPLLRYRHRLHTAVTGSVPSGQTDFWLTGDRQGLGAGR